MRHNHEEEGQCDICDGGYDAFIEHNEELIKSDYKCAVIGVGDGTFPPFTYTVGLTDMGWPELIVAGINPQIGTLLINRIVAHYLEIGVVPADGVELSGDTLDFTYPTRLKQRNDAVNTHMFQAVYRQERVEGPAPTALQIIFPDEDGRFPSDPGVDEKTVRVQLLQSDEARTLN